MLSKSRILRASLAILVALGVLTTTGCSGGLKTYPVKGKVKLGAGDVSLLAGNHVEFALTSDPTVRASGEIQPDGSFIVETLHAGAILKGAREGTYQARLVINDDNKGIYRKVALAPRVFQFQTSGLSVQVPPTNEVTFEIAQR